MIKKITTSILVWEAKLALRHFKPKIIAITGSVGKSSTKEAIAAVLENKFHIRKSQKSYNSELGLALSILGLSTAWHSPVGWLKNIAKGLTELRNKKFPQILILEMGVDRPKDLDKLISIAKPDISVETAIGEIPVQVKFFAGPEEVAKEKSKIVRALGAGGFAVLNFDDAVVWDMKEKTNAHIISYGFNKDADFSASNYKISLEGTNFKIDNDGVSVPITLKNIFGKQNIYPALAAAAVASALGINLIETSGALSIYKALPGRMRLLEGIKDSHILDDSYNASPMAVHEALDTLRDIYESIQENSRGKKIVAFGDMMEIGKFTIEAHKAVGKKAAEFADYFVTVGPRAKFSSDEAIMCGMDKEKVKNFSTSKEAAEYLKPLVETNDLILVKGSQAVRMEKIVLEIMGHPEEAESLLVRQDTYWKNH